MIIIDTTLWHWPQYFMIGMMVFSLFVAGVERKDKHSAAIKLIDTMILVFVLVAGGFFS